MVRYIFFNPVHTVTINLQVFTIKKSKGRTISMRYEEEKKFYKSKGFYIACFLGAFAIVTIVGVQKNLRSRLSDASDQLAKIETLEQNKATENPHTYAAIEEEYTGQTDVTNETAVVPKSDAAITANQQSEASVAATQKPEEDTTETSQEQVAANVEDPDNPEEADTVAAMNAEDSNQGISWPISGDILITYSMDQPVYFSTLGQYKCNPALIIAGTEGKDVVSACDCTITKVERSEETGLTIYAESGNYTYIYGQLANPKVSKGDVVKEGDIIASLAAPTKSYSMEGCNLYFQVKDDGSSVNPLLLLK